MSLTPRGMSIQEAYRNFIEGALVVNRRYQRKLVWTIEEKANLIDSVFRGYPIPLFLLARREGSHFYEIVDGIQRFNSIFSFIHHQFLTLDGRCFDIEELARAKQASEAKIFDPRAADTPRVSKTECASFLDYQLAVTIDSDSSDERVNDVFGRINSGGRRLSFHERRQAGLVSEFSELVRELSSELRGDTSPLRVPLISMPEVSINTPRDRQGYGIDATNVVWCKHGIITANELRDSVDEQLVADLCISWLNEEPLAVSREILDEYYEPNSERFKEINAKLTAFGAERLRNVVKVTFSLFSEVFDTSPKMFRSLVHEKPATTARTAFYAVFMAFHDLVFMEFKKPDNYSGILAALEHVHPKL